jgi:hypothetical protein
MENNSRTDFSESHSDHVSSGSDSSDIPDYSPTIKVELGEREIYAPGYGQIYGETKETVTRIDRMLREQQRAEELNEIAIDPPMGIVAIEGRTGGEIEMDFSIRITLWRIEMLTRLENLLRTPAATNNLQIQLSYVTFISLLIVKQRKY